METRAQKYGRTAKALLKNQSIYRSQSCHGYGTNRKHLPTVPREVNTKTVHKVLRSELDGKKYGIYLTGFHRIAKINFPYLVKWILDATKTGKGGVPRNSTGKLDSVSEVGCYHKPSLSMLQELKKKAGLAKRPGEKLSNEKKQ